VFDDTYEVGLPEKEGRRQILELYLGQCETDLSQRDWGHIVDWTLYFAGSDIKALVERAQVEARLDERGPMTLVDIERAYTDMLPSTPGDVEG
jgi:SpoVK/Ycf46/Vps4 family AAA+-type ATPase